MKRHDQDDFLREIFADEELETLRKSTLARGLGAVRSRRRRRTARVAALAAAPLLLLAAVVRWRGARPTVAEPAPLTTAAVETTSGVKFYSDAVSDDAPHVATISDEQLLALFKGRSVGLLGSPGRQRLVVFNTPAPNTR